MKNIEDIKNNLRDYDYHFLNKMQKYIDTELYFYGSVARFDFFPGDSDIDIIVITDNVNSILQKLQNFLAVDKKSIEKTINYMHDTNNMTYAYKITYEDFENSLYLEVFIYDEKYRDKLVYDINKKNNLPFFMVCILYLLKFFTYYLRIFSEDNLKYLKNTLINLYSRQTVDKHMVNLKMN